MFSRERVITTLEHKEPDRIPIDLGGMRSTGITAIAYNNLKRFLAIDGGRTRVYDYIQQLAEVEIEILKMIGGDILPVSILIIGPKSWRKSILPDGSPCEVPDTFNPVVMPDGSQVIYNDKGVMMGRRPKGGYYFDSIYHPLENVFSIEALEEKEDELCSTLWSASPVSEKIVNALELHAKYLYENTEYALMLNDGGGVYEWAQDLMGWNTFMVNLLKNPDVISTLLDKLVEININRLQKILPAVNKYIQIVQIADDLGMQQGPQISLDLYRKIVKPRHKKICQFIKENCDAYIFLHTCGAIREFIPDLIEIGVDIINPVQVSAKGMDTAELKEEFGDKIVFWGGGCDTQRVLPLGTPKIVEKEVKKRIKDLAPNGGFVFTQVHNIQPEVPPENIMAMYRAVKKYGGYS